MKKATENQLKREIEELLIPELVLSYHNNTHAITRHMNVSHTELKSRLRKKNFQADEIVPISRFYDIFELDDVANLIYDCLTANLNEVKAWLDTYHGKSKDFVFQFQSPIGDGIVKGTNWNRLFPMSDICVILDESNIKGRLFRIVSAYPIGNVDENDVIWNAIDEWTEIQKQKRD